MKPFRFRLQSLLSLREREERKALEAFAAALCEAELSESRLRATQTRINDHWNAAAETLRSGCAPAELQSWQSFGQILVREEARLRAAAVTASEAASLARRALMAARQRREVVEALKTRHRETHERESLHEEQMLLDDIAQRSRKPAFGGFEVAVLETP
jgi:flagellar export protein FliJ